jgi:hypothetical protein
MSPLNQEIEKPALFAVLLGCTPRGRNVEQHDVMFGVAKSIDGLTDSMKTFWHKPYTTELINGVKKIYPNVDVALLEKELLPPVLRRDKVHIDGWVQVNYVDGYRVDILPKHAAGGNNGLRLYFINLGGYKEEEFEEFHKKFFVVAANVSEALAKAKQHPFMQEYSAGSIGIAGIAHLDDQHKITFEPDDIICVSDKLDDGYVLQLEQAEDCTENKLVIGYKKLNYAGE